MQYVKYSFGVIILYVLWTKRNLNLKFRKTKISVHRIQSCVLICFYNVGSLFTFCVILSVIHEDYQKYDYIEKPNPELGFILAKSSPQVKS